MALTWIGSQICTKIRAITGEGTVEDITDAALLDRINDFYRNTFALDAYSSDFEDWFTESFTDGTATYDVSDDYLRLDTPMTTLDSDDDLAPIKFYQDKDEFRSVYPEDPNATECRPAAVLLYGKKLYPGPIPDDTYTFKAACIKKPTALTADTAPPDIRMGPAIAYGTAIEMLMEDNDREAADELVPIYQYFLGQVNKKKMVQKSSQQRATPRF